MAQHGWAALSKMSATSADRDGSVLAGWAVGPGVTRSTRRADAGGGSAGPAGRGGLVQAGEAPAGERAGQDLHAGRLALADPVEGAEEGAEGVDLVLGAQRVLLGEGEAQLAAGRHPNTSERRGGGEGLGAGTGPGGFDSPLDQARRDRRRAPTRRWSGRRRWR